METINQSLRAKFAKNYGRIRKIHGIVLHDTAGSGTHNDTRYLANPGDGRMVSVDFTVERDGAIYQLSPDLTTYYCYHAGRNTKFKGFYNGQVNIVTVGIEIVQKANLALTPMWPDDQVKSVGELCRYLCDKFNLKPEDITTHAKIITDRSRTDPRKFPFDVFWKYFNGTEETPMHPETPTFDHRIIHKVGPGDTLWGISVKYQVSQERIKALNPDKFDGPSTTIYVGQLLLIDDE